MPKLDLFGLPRSERVTSEKTYREAGQEITLALRWPNASDRAMASEEAQILSRDYLTGDGEREAATFPDPDVQPSVTLFNACALVARMQCTAEARERYEPVELAILSARLPRTWIAIQQEVNRILGEGDRIQGELPGERTASSAETPSPSIPNTP